MPFKIYTYADPYRISQTDFGEEIKRYPHLCASRTLVRGLLSVLPESEVQALFCPLDAIVNDRVYADWSKNISRRIQQYSELGRIYSKWHKQSPEKFDDTRYEAFEHNKNSMLDSIRLFRELGIRSNSLNARNLNIEHKTFVFLLKYAESNPLFALPQMPEWKQIKIIFEEQAVAEKKAKEDRHKNGIGPDKGSYQQEIAMYERMVNYTKQWDCKHIVVHGIHQFTPLQLRFLTYLDKLGIEIIFLFNYLPEFKEIYSSWNYIYQQFDAPVHHDSLIPSYVPSMDFPRSGSAIAVNLALLCEENIRNDDPRIKKNYAHYKDERVIEFDNISEYAGYVSDVFGQAVKELKEQSDESQTGLENKGTASVLARMNDVIYTANKDVDELLQVYHPEYARNRHFLAYPIGQFFVALYSLWNMDEGQIDIDFVLLRTCVNSGILTGYNSERLLKTLMNVEPMFSHITLFSKFKERFLNYKQQYKNASTSLRQINMYNDNKVTLDDISVLYSAICDINNCATMLFGETGTNEQFRFGEHFRRLQSFVDEKKNALANEAEKDLIIKLLERLNTIQNQLNLDDRKGTLDDLRSGLYFFLKQKEEPVSDWFVRNFEQIDGDVLLSKKQNKPGKEKTYHFACVSDKDMNRTVDELLPWPLSERFIEKAYNPQELPFQVYYASLIERSNFLRYALFYGLYFSQCDTKISFVKNYGNDATDYYEMLRLIGLKKADNTSYRRMEDYPVTTLVRAKNISSVRYDREQMVAMFLCPYRYFNDYILNPQPVINGVFLIQRFFINTLIENTWKNAAGKKSQVIIQSITQLLDLESKKIERFFSFFSESEIIDMKKQAENYLINNVLNGSDNIVRACDITHMQFRKIFGLADFHEEYQDLPFKHKYPPFENLSRNKDGKKSYSAHQVPKVESEELVNCVLNYINESSQNLERVGSWCAYCPDRGICLAPFAEKHN